MEGIGIAGNHRQLSIWALLGVISVSAIASAPPASAAGTCGGSPEDWVSGPITTYTITNRNGEVASAKLVVDGRKTILKGPSYSEMTGVYYFSPLNNYLTVVSETAIGFCTPGSACTSTNPTKYYTSFSDPVCETGSSAVVSAKTITSAMALTGALDRSKDVYGNALRSRP